MIEKETICRDILHAYYAYPEWNIQSIDEGKNPINDEVVQNHFCKWLKNYFRIEMPFAEIAQGATLTDFIATLSRYLPSDEVDIYRRITLLYGVLLTNAREEMAEWHKTYLQFTRKLQADVDEIEQFTTDIIDENYD